MHDRVCGDLPRTINSLEGWHNHLQANITSSHPNIWRFLQVLKTKQALNDTIINQMLAGQEPPSRFFERNSSQFKILVAFFMNCLFYQ